MNEAMALDSLPMAEAMFSLRERSVFFVAVFNAQEIQSAIDLAVVASH